jgi:hydrogenase nickel incorporation protein HypA/HybF
VHELSIAHSLVSLVEERLPPGTSRVIAVDLRLGVLAGVVTGALEFCYGIATDGTSLQGSALRITELPIVIHCPTCQSDREIAGISFTCPVCQTPSGDIRQGRELDLASIEYDTEQSSP